MFALALFCTSVRLKARLRPQNNILCGIPHPSSGIDFNRSVNQFKLIDPLFIEKESPITIKNEKYWSSGSFLLCSDASSMDNGLGFSHKNRVSSL
jgi:hypothetical protein